MYLWRNYNKVDDEWWLLSLKKGTNFRWLFIAVLCRFQKSRTFGGFQKKSHFGRFQKSRTLAVSKKVALWPFPKKVALWPFPKKSHFLSFPKVANSLMMKHEKYWQKENLMQNNLMHIDCPIVVYPLSIVYLLSLPVSILKV